MVKLFFFPHPVQYRRYFLGIFVPGWYSHCFLAIFPVRKTVVPLLQDTDLLKEGERLIANEVFPLRIMHCNCQWKGI